MIIKSYNNVFLENRLFFKEKREMLGTCLENVRTQVPLVHNITNYVTVNDVANVLLACGGSPIMADETHDRGNVTCRKTCK